MNEPSLPEVTPLTSEQTRLRMQAYHRALTTSDPAEALKGVRMDPERPLDEQIAQARENYRRQLWLKIVAGIASEEVDSDQHRASLKAAPSAS